MIQRPLLILAGVAALLVAAPRLAAAQSDDRFESLRRDVESLKNGQAAIRRDLQELKDLLQGRIAAPPQAAAPQSPVVTIKGDPVKGSPAARLTLVEFSDYQCPFCSRYFRETWPLLESEQIAAGRIKYVFRNFPIEAIHPLAFKAHEAALCAGEQGKYWELHDRLFGNQQALASAQLSEHARALSLDQDAFLRCLDSGRTADKIRQDQTAGQSAGVQGTPTFFLGVSNGDGDAIQALRVIRGAQPYAVFKDAIDGALAGLP